MSAGTAPGDGAMRVVVTGGAGFIGSHLCARLLERGDRVWAVDSFDPFYDPAIKRRGLEPLLGDARFSLVEADVRDLDGVLAGLAAAGAEPGGVDVIVHLAAKAGVRPSIEQPLLYAQVNVDGTAAMLEAARRLRVPDFVFGSSSSVYGNSERVPFHESDPVDRPISPYAATKRAGELLCHAHAHLHGTAVVCLRFFTVYGPRQRPDLAIHKFARLMAEGRPIPFYGDGSTRRDYTYVDDIVQGVEGAMAYARAHPGCFELFNLGESDTVTLSRLVEVLGRAMGTEPVLERLPAQPGDVERTYADIGRAREMLGYAPATRIEDGVPRFVEWFRAERARGM
ncbi:MAG TPA: SDR family NAD(P)-dependent oxidoreductase [Longimicrobium sp.]|nr:SDR family NAD(P)-dependent oxidoreductase [Longimicrobium sp.]